MNVELDTRPPFTQAPGVTPPSTPTGRPDFLSEVIIELGFADREVVDDAVEESRLLGKQAESLMVEKALISEEQLARAIAERNGLPYVELAEFVVDQGATRLVGSDTATRYRAVPIAFDADGALIVALADPLDALAVSDIGVITRSEVRPAVATEAGIETLLATMPPSPPPRLSHQMPEEPEVTDAPDANGGEAPAWTLSQSIPAPEPKLQIPEPGRSGLPPLLQPIELTEVSEAPLEPEYAALAEPEPIVDPEPFAEPEPEPMPEPEPFVEPEPIVDVEPTVAAEPEPSSESEPMPDPPAIPDPPAAPNGSAHHDQAPPALQSRIMGLVAAALDEVAESEVERLEAEVADERRALEEARDQIEGLTARVETLERKSSEVKEQRDQYKAERDELRDAAAEAQAASEREREHRAETEARVRDRVARATHSSEGVNRSLDQLAEAIAAAREAARDVAALHLELGDELSSAE